MTGGKFIAAPSRACHSGSIDNSVGDGTRRVVLE